MTPYPNSATPQQAGNVSSFHSLVSILNRRLPLILVVSLTIIFATILKVFLQPVYSQNFKLLLDSATAENPSNAFPENKQKPYIPYQFRDYKTDMEVLASYRVISPLLPSIQTRYPHLDYTALVNQLSIKREKDSAIVIVSYQDNNPDKVKFVLEKLATGYTSYSLERFKTSSAETIQLVETQLPKLRERVNRLQLELQKFRQQHNLFDPEQQSQVISGRLNSLVQQRQDVQISLRETESIAGNLRQQLASKVSQTRKSSTSSKNLRNLTLLDEGLAFSSPDIIRARLTLDLVKTNNQLIGLQARQQSLATSENEVRQQLQQFAKLNRQYTDLRRELEIATDSLKRYLTAKENLQIEIARKVSVWEVISELKTPSQPILPKLRNLLVGCLAGLLAGVGVALLTEQLDNRHRSPKEKKQ